MYTIKDQQLCYNEYTGNQIINDEGQGKKKLKFKQSKIAFID